MSPDDEKAWSEMWQRKADGREMFAKATLLVDHEFQRWNGHKSDRGQKPEYTRYLKKAGEQVLITVASGLGENCACIRGTDIDKEEHGYDSRIHPDKLKDITFLSNGGRPWRREMFEKMGCWDGYENGG